MDERTAASAGVDGMARLWNAKDGRLIRSLEGHVGGVRRVALSADARMLDSLTDHTKGVSRRTWRFHGTPTCLARTGRVTETAQATTTNRIGSDGDHARACLTHFPPGNTFACSFSAATCGIDWRTAETPMAQTGRPRRRERRIRVHMRKVGNG